MAALNSLSQVSISRLMIAAAALCICLVTTANAQTATVGTVAAKESAAKPTPAADDKMFDGIYRKFNDTYRLGPADVISIRIKGQPDYSDDKVKVSPTGTIYHVLLGEISVVGMTITQLTERLTNDLSEYLKNPQVNVQLAEAVSAKISVLGDVIRPDIYVMARPMTLLDVISAAGGFTDTGNKSSVVVNRQAADGSRKLMTVNVKQILEGKASPEANIQMQGGDVVIVGGNAKKTIATITSLAGFGNFLSFITFGRR